jgi:hypothetical protein
MNCEKFLALDDYAQSQYLAELIHACTNDDTLFLMGQQVIEEGKKNGLFERVKIGHQAVNNSEQNE